ncbi:SGNH/GDSL hydrolase family protein [Sphaerisporangium fuscum]|uniref:SGNH/GDSL hydrolase family protein n=1 Tax=Sphaerisporangium fuscum TaxID=2835868 RepID=UPI001BDBC334|nr:SGNH/GDSL hydrolase family protein [Sphaerisporangium fuscum]
MGSGRSPRFARALPAAVLAAAVLWAAPPAQAHDRPDGPWVASWGAAMQRPTPGTEDNGPNWSMPGFADQSVRQVVRVTAGGSRLRIRLSNAYGTAPLRVTAATVGRSGGGALVWPDSMRRLAFGGAPGTVIPPGGEAVSDAVALPTSPLEKLAVTLRLNRPTGPATFHRFTTATSYRAKGDHLSGPGAEAYTESTGAWYYLAGVEVTGGAAPQGTVVAFGDSLVDGVGSTAGADARFTDKIAERLVTARRPVSVVNAGIAGSRLLNDSSCFGEKAGTRFRRDVLDRPGVSAVIVHLGANDIGYPQLDDACVRPNPRVTVRQLVAGYQSLIQAAHARGVKVIGVTIPPLRGALFPFWTPDVEKARGAVNQWIRTSGAYDAVLDADRAMADPAHPDRPRPGYVFHDGLHPDDAGYHAIASALDLDAL